MSSAEWKHPFPETDCWYQYFKHVILAYNDLKRMRAERAADAEAKMATLAVAEAQTISFTVGQRVEPVVESRLFTHGEVIEVLPSSIRVQFDETPAGEYRSGENPATVLPEWFVQEPPRPVRKPNRTKSKKKLPVEE